MSTWTDEQGHPAQGTQEYNNWEYIYNDVNITYNGQAGTAWTDLQKEQPVT